MIIFLKNMAVSGNLKNHNQEQSKQVVWWQPAITMFLKLSVWIAAPVIIALYLGKWLDKRYATEPWLFLASVGLAFLISLFGLIRNAAKEFKKLEKTNKDK